MSAVESVAEAVKKRARSSSKTRAPTKRAKSTLEGLSSPSSSQTPPPAGRPSKAPAAASVFGQAPFEGEPPLSHLSASQVTPVFSHASASQATPVFSHSSASQASPVFSQATSVLSQVTSALSQVPLPVLEPAARNQPSIPTLPVAPPPQAVWGGEGKDSASERSFSPPRVPDFRQELDDFRNTIRAEQRQTAARQEQAFLAASDRFYYAQQDQFAQLQQLLLQQVHCQQPMAPSLQQPMAPSLQPALPPPPAQSTDLPRWEYEEQDYDDSDQESDEEPLQAASSDAPTKGEIQSLLGILKDTLGIAVTTPEAEPAPDAGTVFSDDVAPDSSLVFPIDPAVSKRAATISLKKSKPLGAELKILQNDHAAVVSNTPIPDDVWDRLLSFDKAKVTGRTSVTNQDKRICRLADKADSVFGTSDMYPVQPHR